MRLFSIHGGVHPPDRKDLAADQPIRPAPLPPLLHIPLQQHIGAPAQAVVSVGQRVAKGELLARGQGKISAPVHASTSGTIRAIGDCPAPHASGLTVAAITLEPDGEDRWSSDLTGAAEPFTLTASEIAARVAAAGIVGMGGATFPAAVKLNLGEQQALHTLVINGSECEPYLTCDDRLMREQAAELVDGVRLMAHALGVTRIIVAIENNKPQAQQAVGEAIKPHAEIRLARLPNRYPMGSEKHLVKVLTGQETPAGRLTADIGVVVHNPATTVAVHEALRYGRPLVSRVMTISGHAIARPSNLRIAIGTPLAHLLEVCSGFTAPPARLISGGPMMGQAIPGTEVPAVKGSNGLLALTARESTPRQPMPCIRCGGCVAACPVGLVPLELAARIRTGDFDGSAAQGLHDCIACGSCAYTCPAHIPLVQYFQHAKGVLAERARQQQKLALTKRLAEQRAARLEALKQAKRAAMKRKRAAQQSASSDATEASA